MALDQNILLATNDVVQHGTIHHPLAQPDPDLVLSNLQVREHWMFGQFPGPYKGQTKFDVELGSTQYLNLIAFLKHNMGPLALWRVSLADSQVGLDTPTYTSGWLPVHPAITGAGTLAWGQFDWGGISPVIQQTYFNRNAYHPLPDTLSASWIRYEFDDESDVFSRAYPWVYGARAWASAAYQPSTNVQYGAEVTPVDATGISRAGSGAKHHDKRIVRWREMALSFNDLPNAELMYYIFGPLLMEQGKTGELIVIKFPLQPETYAFEAIYGSLTDLAPTVDSYWVRKTTDLRIEEIV